MTLLDLYPRNPYRPVDWRWRLAGLVRSGSIPRRRPQDPWVRQAIRFQDRLEAVRLRRRHALTLASIEAAHEIRNSPDTWVRFEIETRVLAHQQFEVIASRCNLTRDVVETYERLFFAVTDKLDAQDYIAFVIDPTASRYRGAPSEEVVVKMLSYQHGPNAADEILTYLRRRDRGTASIQPGEIMPGFDRWIQLALDVASQPMTETNLLHSLRLFLLLDHLDDVAATRTAGAEIHPVTVPSSFISSLQVSENGPVTAREEAESTVVFDGMGKRVVKSDLDEVTNPGLLHSACAPTDDLDMRQALDRRVG